MRSEEDSLSGEGLTPHSSPLTPHALGRLRWRCRRGMLELDLVLARFLGENYTQLTTQQQQEFEALLELEDHELWQRVCGEAATASVVERMLRGCHNT